MPADFIYLKFIFYCISFIVPISTMSVFYEKHGLHIYKPNTSSPNYPPVCLTISWHPLLSFFFFFSLESHGEKHS